MKLEHRQDCEKKCTAYRDGVDCHYEHKKCECDAVPSSFSTVREKILADFRRKYEEAYKGILSDEVLEKGNPWFEDFVLGSLDLLLTEIVEAAEDMRKNLVTETEGTCNPRCHDSGRDSQIDNFVSLLQSHLSAKRDVSPH